MIPAIDISDSVPQADGPEQKPRGFILIADGSVEARDFLMLALSRMGYAIQVAADRNTALAIAVRRNPNVIITSMEMEGLPLEQFLNEVKAISPAPCILLRLEKHHKEDIAAGQRVKHVFRSPINLAILERALSECLGERR